MKGIFEPCFLELETQTGFRFVCGVIYGLTNNAGQKHKLFLNLLNAYLDKITSEKKAAIICGDFNYEQADNSQKGTMDFKSSLYRNNFFPCINRPTRYPKKRGASPSLLDNIWVNINLSDKDLKAAILAHLFKSDHLAICCSLSLNECPLPYDFMPSNLRQFSTNLTELSWEESNEDNESFQSTNANQLIQSLKQNVTGIVKNLKLKSDTHCISWKKTVFKGEFGWPDLNKELIKFTKFLLVSLQNKKVETKNKKKLKTKKRSITEPKKRTKSIIIYRRNTKNILLGKHLIVPPPPFNREWRRNVNCLEKLFKTIQSLKERTSQSEITLEGKHLDFPLDMLLGISDKTLRKKIFSFFQRVFNETLKSRHDQGLLQQLLEPVTVQHQNQNYKLNLFSMLLWCIHDANICFRKYFFASDFCDPFAGQFGFHPISVSQKQACLNAAIYKITCALQTNQYVQAITFNLSKIFQEILDCNWEVQNLDIFPLSDFATYEWFSGFRKILKFVYGKFFSDKPKHFSLVEQFFLRKVINDLYKNLPDLLAFEHEHILLVSSENPSDLETKTKEQLNRLNNWLKNDVKLQSKPENIKFMVFSENCDANEAQKQYTFAGNAIENYSKMRFLGEELHKLIKSENILNSS